MLRDIVFLVDWKIPGYVTASGVRINGFSGKGAEMAGERLNMAGRVAVVTGGAKGVGFGIASVLAEFGASVAIMSRTAADVDAAVAKLKSKGYNAIGLAGDVTLREDNARLVEAALDSFGKLDIAIANAGGTSAAQFDDVTEDGFVADMQLNVFSTLHLAQLSRRHLEKSGDGAIVTISSTASRISYAPYITYSVTKNALERFTQVMAQELAPLIRVNSIALGMTATDALLRGMELVEGGLEKARAQVPLQRIGNVEDVGLAALYLCARESTTTGQILSIDGGLLYQPN